MPKVHTASVATPETWWHVVDYSWQPEIRPVKVIGVTAKQVRIMSDMPGAKPRTRLREGAYYPTWMAAKEYLLSKAHTRVVNAETKLAVELAEHDRVVALQPPPEAVRQQADIDA